MKKKRRINGNREHLVSSLLKEKESFHPRRVVPLVYSKSKLSAVKELTRFSSGFHLPSICIG